MTFMGITVIQKITNKHKGISFNRIQYKLELYNTGDLFWNKILFKYFLSPIKNKYMWY